MRKQNGCIRAHGNWWTVLYRENGKLQSKQLREIVSEDRKSKDRNKKLRIPRDVEDLAREHMDVVNRAAGNPGSAHTMLKIGEMVEKHYFPDMEEDWAPSSAANYRCIWNRHLKPRIAQRIVRDFRVVDATYLWMAIHKDNPELRQRTMRQIQAVLQDIFKWALGHGMFDDDRANPASAELPKGLRPNKDTEAYTAEEIGKMLRLCIDPKLTAVIAIFFGSGVRRDEGRGLCWKDYRRLEKGGILNVVRQFKRWGEQELKTDNSKSHVYLNEAICRRIDTYRATLPEGADSGWMFPGLRTAAKPMDMDSFSTSHLQPFLKSAGIPYKGGFHAYRRGGDTEIANYLDSETAAAHGRHTVEVAEQSYIKGVTDQEKRASRAAKVVDIERRRDERLRAAADLLGARIESEAVN